MVLVFVHEMGHLLLAKVLGVRVLSFSIGFGPKIFSFNYKKTKYSVGIIPLGGYIKMFGELLEDKVLSSEKRYSFLYQPVWKKLLIAFAGPFFNLIFPIFLLFFIFFGNQTFILPVVGSTVPNSVASNSGLISGDRILKVSGERVNNFSQVASIILDNPKKKLVFLIERFGKNKRQVISLVIIPEQYNNPHPLFKNEFLGKIGIMPDVQKPIIIVPYKNSIAFQSGVRTFDRVIYFMNNKIFNFSELELLFLRNSIFYGEVERSSKDKVNVISFKSSLFNQKIINRKIKIFYHSIIAAERLDKTLLDRIKKTKQSIIAFKKGLITQKGISFAVGSINKIAKGSPAHLLGLSFGDKILSINGKNIFTLQVLEQELLLGQNKIHIASIIGNNEAKIIVFRFHKSKKVKLKISAIEEFGMFFMPAYKQGITYNKSVKFFDSFRLSILQTLSLILMMLKSLWMFISLKIPLSQLGGPIMVFDIASQASSISLSYYFYVMSLISINLGLLNLLPIPVLDGGYLVLFFVEAVQQKPITIRIKKIAFKIGIVFLFILMFLAFFNDIYRFFY